MRLDRLKKCLASLPRRETKREKFDLHEFLMVEKCGTTACALGWYRYKNPSSRIGSFDRRLGALGGWICDDDAMIHFGISHEEVHYLFWRKHGRGSRLHNSLAGTRQRIRDFISTHSKEGAK